VTNPQAWSRERENAHVLEHSDGVLRSRSWHIADGEREPWIVYRVIVDGRQVGLWTKRRWARRDLRQHLRKRKGS
jgi:hypothetical protein